MLPSESKNKTFTSPLPHVILMNYIIYEGDSAATTVGVERPRILTQNLNSTFILLKCHFMTLLFQVTLHEQTNKMLKFYVLVLCINSRGCLFY